MTTDTLSTLLLSVEQHVRLHQVLRGCARVDLWLAHRDGMSAELRGAVDAADRASAAEARHEAMQLLPPAERRA